MPTAGSGPARASTAGDDGATILSIDALRAVAAFAIVVFHYKNFFRGAGVPGDATLAELQALPWFQALEPLTRHGALAVMLFWMISGFVLLHAYAGRRSVSARAYAVNRLSRLYPLHLATLLGVAAIQAVSMRMTGGWQIYQHNDLQHFVLQLLFVSNWVSDVRSFNGPIWSVSAEIFAYAAFFAFLRSGASTLPRIAAFGVGFCALFAATGLMPALCGVYFFAGCAVCRVWRLLAMRSPGRALAAACLAAGAAAAAWAAAGAAGRAAVAGLPLTLLLVPVFGLGLLILALAESSLRTRRPDGAGMRALARIGRAGDVTYASYLLHSPLQMLFLLAVAAGLAPLDAVLSPAFALAYLCGVFGLSWLAFHGFERPAQRALRAALVPAPGGGRARPASA